MSTKVKTDENTAKTGLAGTASQNNNVVQLNGPPVNIEAEQALLGAILVNNEALERVGAWLEADHFGDALHGRIYAACKGHIEKGHLATPVTLKNFFEDEEPVRDGLSVPQYLGTLAAHAVTIVNAAEYGQTVYDLAARRALLALSQELAARVCHVDYSDSITAIIEDAEAALYQIGDKSGRLNSVVSYSAALKECINDIDEAQKRGDGLVGLGTGISSLNQRFGGFAAGDLIVIGARPSMGKTTLALNMATHIARGGDPVGVFSLEMAARQLAQKNLATRTGIPVQRMRNGNVSEDEFRLIVKEARESGELPFYTDQQAGISIATLAMRARRMKRKLGIKALFVDYLQLMQPAQQNSYSNRVAEITAITMGLKNLAKELQIPVIALSQLSRGLENRADKRPMLADLRESGSIEQDADIVLFVYREEFYLSRAKPRDNDPEYMNWQTHMNEVRGRAEIIIGKQRHGALGTDELGFDGVRSLFYDEGHKPQMNVLEFSQERR